MDKAIFLALDELADELPPICEEIIPIDMDAEQAKNYKVVEDALRGAIMEAIKAGDRSLMSRMLWTLLGYPDHPYGYGDIGYMGRDDFGEERWVHVVSPPDMDPDILRPKEQALLEWILEEARQGRQVWVYVEMTDKKDILPRLQRLLQEEGVSTTILRAAKPQPRKREQWIEQNGPKTQVVLSHAALVQTGLDLFCKKGAYNFASLAFYETGYSLTTLRQAGARAWRIGQTLLCKVAYFFYNGTMQANAMKLMGEKLEAAEALEGKFSEEGLVSLAEADSETLALAKSLVNGIDRKDVQRQWERIKSTSRSPSGGERSIIPMRQVHAFRTLPLFDDTESMLAESAV